MHTVTRYHDFSCGHRVADHESKCAHLHGHNYRVHFTCEAKVNALDSIGRVVDFSALKSMSNWLEERWDHRMLVWEKDSTMRELSRSAEQTGTARILRASIVWVPFNPTAENMAQHLVEVVGPHLLPPNILLTSVRIEETRKCSATYHLPRNIQI